MAGYEVSVEQVGETGRSGAEQKCCQVPRLLVSVADFPFHKYAEVLCSPCKEQADGG